MGSKLSNFRIVVTSAASGIGAATVARLRQDGAQVFGTDKSGETDLQIDVTGPHASDTILNAATEKMGGYDALVTCAGISQFELLEGHSDALWDATMAINVTAVFRLVRAATPTLKLSKAGRIVTIGSVMSSFAATGLAAYTASKHAVLGLTRSMAAELGPYGITVNCVQPGAILTPMTADYLTREDVGGAFWKAKSSLGRLGQPDDIADVIAFLVSDDARFVSGHGIFVDGGAMQKA